MYQNIQIHIKIVIDMPYHNSTTYHNVTVHASTYKYIQVRTRTYQYILVHTSTYHFWSGFQKGANQVWNHYLLHALGMHSPCTENVHWSNTGYATFYFVVYLFPFSCFWLYTWLLMTDQRSLSSSAPAYGHHVHRQASHDSPSESLHRDSFGRVQCAGRRHSDSEHQTATWKVACMRLWVQWTQMKQVTWTPGPWSPTISWVQVMSTSLSGSFQLENAGNFELSVKHGMPSMPPSYIPSNSQIRVNFVMPSDNKRKHNH